MSKQHKQPAARWSESDIRRGVRAILAKYRAVEQTRQGVRARPPLEFGNEETILSQFDRLQAIAIGRDLERNSSKAITIVQQRKVLTCGKVKAQFNTAEETWNAAADRVFNSSFARDCWFSDAAHLETVAQWVEAALLREGDILVAFDDFLLDTGKVILWEADQLVDPAAADWKLCWHPWCWTETTAPGVTVKHPFTVDQGVIVDQYGRTVAFCVSNLHFAEKGERAQCSLPLADCLIIPADRARLVRRRFRPGERRGVPALLPVSGNLADIEEMVQSELSTARMRSKIMAWVKHSKDAGLPADAAADVAQFLAAQERGATVEQALADVGVENAEAEADPSAEAAASGDAGAPADGRSYRKISEAVGGMLDYLEEGDDITVPGIDRPNLNTAAFFDALGDAAGAAVGLARGYTRMAVSSSYTAHRGETCMTDRHIRAEQKQHEHDWLDWLAVKVIRRAIERGELAEGPDGWEAQISWGMPRPDAIDPEKEERALLLAMKNGSKTLRDAAGPDWKRKLRDFAAQLAEAVRLKLPLSVFDTVAGAAATIPDMEESTIEEEDNE